jgi:RNA polymerase sigma-70 factor (ECF subfamily)
MEVHYVIEMRGSMLESEKNAIKEASKLFLKDPEGQFASFYELTKEKVYFLIYSYVRENAEAEDILQNAYVSLLKNVSTFKVHLNPYSYLCSSAKNLAIDELRKRKKNVELDDEGVSDVIGNDDPPIDESGPLLLEIKKLLSPFEFQVFTLRILSDMSFKEISKSLNRPVGTLTYTYSVALDKLKKGLDKKWMTNLNQI